AGGAGGIVAAGGREGGGERERVGGRVEVGGAPKPSLPPPRRCLKDSPADRQDDRRKPDGARDWIESFPVKSDHEKTDRRRRDEQEWEQGTGLPLFPGRDEPDSQFLENEKAENNDAGAYCQGHSPPPSKEKTARREEAADPRRADPDAADNPFVRAHFRSSLFRNRHRFTKAAATPNAEPTRAADSPRRSHPPIHFPAR